MSDDVFGDDDPLDALTEDDDDDEPAAGADLVAGNETFLWGSGEDR